MSSSDTTISPITVFTPPPLPDGLNPTIANALLTHMLFRALCPSMPTFRWQLLGLDEITRDTIRAETGYVTFPPSNYPSTLRATPVLNLSAYVFPDYETYVPVAPVYFPDFKHYANWCIRWLAEFDLFNLTKKESTNGKACN